MESGEQFDWANKRSVVVKRVDPIAIYVDSEGDIIIRQQHPDRPLDSVITIPAHQVYGARPCRGKSKARLRRSFRQRVSTQP